MSLMAWTTLCFSTSFRRRAKYVEIGGTALPSISIMASRTAWKLLPHAGGAWPAVTRGDG